MSMNRSNDYVEIIRLHGNLNNDTKLLSELISTGGFKFLLLKQKYRHPRLFVEIRYLKILEQMNPVIGERLTINLRGKKFKINQKTKTFQLPNLDFFKEIVSFLSDVDSSMLSVELEIYPISYHHTEGIGKKLGARLKIIYTDKVIENFLKAHLYSHGQRYERSPFSNYPILSHDEILSIIPKNFNNFSYGQLKLGESMKSGYIKVDIEEHPHILITGTTGSGKSTMVYNIIKESLTDLDWKVITIDPHGETANNLANVQQNYGQISPSDGSGINIISNIQSTGIYKLAEEIISVLKSIREAQYADQYFGPRMEDIILKGIVETSKIEGNTLYELYRLLKDRKRIEELAYERSEFIQELASLSDEELASSIRAIGRLVIDPQIRHMVCSRRNRSVLDHMQDGLLLINLDRSKLGYENSKILSNLFLVRLWQEIQSSTSRSKYLLVLEEAQDYVSEVLFDILSAGRKYGLNVIMVTTSLLSIDERIRGKMLSNLGNLVILRQSPSDLNILSNVFNLPVHQFPQAKLEFLYFAGGFKINGKIRYNINKNDNLSSIQTPQDVEMLDIMENVQYMINRMKERGDVFFIMPEFYMYFKLDRSLILKMAKQFIEKDEKIVLVKRVDVDYLGINGRYQCYKVITPKNERIKLAPLFERFNAYLSSKLGYSNGITDEVNKP